MSVDINDANKAWAEKLGVTYPMLSDARRQMSKAYGVLNDDPTMAEDPQRIAAYLRAKRAWFVIDKQGVIRHIFNDMFNAQKHIGEALKVVQSISGE